MNQVKEGQRVSKQVLTRRFITEVWTAGDGAQCGALTPARGAAEVSEGQRGI